MGITILRPGTPEAWPNCAVSLADYIRAVGYDEAAFWGVFYAGQELNDCATLWLEVQRLAVADALAQAQLMIENIIGYPLCPRWFTDNQLYCSRNIITRWGQLLIAGQQAITTVSAGAVVNYTLDPATIGPLATTATDASEIHVYLPSTGREVMPSSIVISGGMVTIRIPRIRLVADVDSPQTGYDFTDLANFTGTVDVKRSTNDPTTTATLLSRETACAIDEASACLRIEDARRGFIRISQTGDTAPCPSIWSQYAVDLYYKAGLVVLPTDLKNAIIRLAHTLMPESICNQCDQIHRLWERDTKVSDVLTRERINCPFGLSAGAWFAYKVAQTNKLWRAGSL